MNKSRSRRVAVCIKDLRALNSHINELETLGKYVDERQKEPFRKGVRDCLSRYHAIRGKPIDGPDEAT
jgi:hypothetical protein